MDPLQPQDPTELGDWKIIARLASSENSNIYLGHRGIEGLEQAAIKVLSEEISSDLNAIDRLKVEAEALKKINNPYIAKLVDYNLESKPVWIATEYIDRKTLDAKLKQDGKPITGQEWWQLAAKIFNGLKAIHSEKIIHKDIKPANIIISGEQVKIIDFGISYVPGNTGKIDFTTIQFEGSRPFAAPENFTSKDSEKMDVFSAAVTLAYAGRLRSIWNDENESTLRNCVIREKPDLTGLDPEQIELLEPLLDKFPSKRPSSAEAEGKILQYIEYLVGKSNNKPNPLKGSSFLYRLIRKKVFATGLVAILVLIGGFVLSSKNVKTIYLPNPTPNPTITISASPPETSSQNSTKGKSSSVACEDEYVNKGKNVISLCLAPAKSGDLPAIYYLGKEYFNNKNYKEAEKWFLIGADQISLQTV
jgi:serine/threonine protein kinase